MKDFREVFEERQEGMSEEPMDFLEDLYPDGVDGVELNDLISYDWEWLYNQIGMPIDEDEEED